LHAEFAGLDVQVLGISVDSIPSLRAWAKSLGGINYPLLSDFWPHGEVAKRYGVLRPEGRSERAIFIIDKEGIIRYIDIHDIDEQPDNEVLLDELKKIIPGAEEKLKHLYKDADEIPDSGVVLYCTPWCPDCRRARVWLKDNNIEYTEVDISSDLNAARQVRAWGEGFQISPTFEVDGKVILDFDKSQLEKLLLNK
jgi:glutaredoxin